MVAEEGRPRRAMAGYDKQDNDERKVWRISISHPANQFHMLGFLQRLENAAGHLSGKRWHPSLSIHISVSISIDECYLEQTIGTISTRGHVSRVSYKWIHHVQEKCQYPSQWVHCEYAWCDRVTFLSIPRHLEEPLAEKIVLCKLDIISPPGMNMPKCQRKKIAHNDAWDRDLTSSKGKWAQKERCGRCRKV